MKTTTRLIKAKKLILRIAEQENVLSDAIAWAKYFGDDLDNLPTVRFAQHVKAALTKKIHSKQDCARVFAIIDKINVSLFGHCT